MNVLFGCNMRGDSQAYLRPNKTWLGNLLTNLNNDWHRESKIRKIELTKFILVGFSFCPIVKPIALESHDHCSWVFSGMLVNSTYWCFCQICLLSSCKWARKSLEQSKDNKQGEPQVLMGCHLAFPVSVSCVCLYRTHQYSEYEASLDIFFTKK